MRQNGSNLNERSGARPTARRDLGQLPSGQRKRHRKPGAMYLNHSRGFSDRSARIGNSRTPRRSSRLPYALIAVGCALVLFIAAVVGYVNRSVDVELNGQKTAVRVGSTLQNLIDDQELTDTYDAGDLLAVDDSVLKRHGGEKLSVKELGRDYRLVLKNLRFVAGALATGFVSLPLLAWIAQSPVIIISGEQATSYEYGMLQVPIFGALIAGNLVLARLTARRTVRSLIIMGGWPIMFGLILSAAATVVSSHAYLWMTAGLSFYAFGIGLANAGLVRLTLFASEMSKGTVSAAMGMLQMLIFTVGIELSKHAYELGGNGLFSLFNLLGGVLWLGLMIYFLKDKSVGNSQQG